MNYYVVVSVSGTGSGAAPGVALAPPDMLVSLGTGSTFSLVDVSNAIAGQTASNISFTASGSLNSTDVQAALQEVDAEKLPLVGGTLTGDLHLGTSVDLVFEGSANDEHETTITVTNPTTDRTITFGDETGTVLTTGATGVVSSAMIVDGTIVNADINAAAEIAVSKLAERNCSTSSFKRIAEVAALNLQATSTFLERLTLPALQHLTQQAVLLACFLQTPN